MRSFLIYLIATIVFSTSVNGQIKFWEDLSCSRKTDILRACQSEEVKKLYNGDFVLSDDEKTEKLLNELVTSNDAILPLSFYLFNKIIVESDGALSEMVGEYCIEFLARHPRYILTYFTKERELSIKKPLWRIYAQFVGYELYFKNKGTSDLKYNYRSYKELLIASYSGKNGNEETLKIFWQLVDETMKKMN